MSTSVPLHRPLSPNKVNRETGNRIYLGRSVAFILVSDLYIHELPSKKIYEKTFRTHEMPVRRNVGPTDYPRENVEPTKYPLEKLRPREIPTRKNSDQTIPTRRSFGPLKYPPEEMADPPRHSCT